MKYRVKIVKVTSTSTERLVANFDIAKIEIKGETAKIKFLPTLKALKDAIIKDIFRP